MSVIETNDNFDEVDVAAENEFAAKPANISNRNTILIFIVLLMGGTGVWLMYTRAGAATANAADLSAADDARVTIDGFLGQNSTGVASMQKMLKNTEQVVQQFLSYPSMTQVPLSDLRSNPFRFRAAAGAPVSDAAERQHREEARQVFLASVQKLQLQSVVLGDSRSACMINSKMFKEGQTIEGLTVENISREAVVVKGGEFRSELKIQR